MRQCEIFGYSGAYRHKLASASGILKITIPGNLSPEIKGNPSGFSELCSVRKSGSILSLPIWINNKNGVLERTIPGRRTRTQLRTEEVPKSGRKHSILMVSYSAKQRMTFLPSTPIFCLCLVPEFRLDLTGRMTSGGLAKKWVITATPRTTTRIQSDDATRRLAGREIRTMDLQSHKPYPRLQVWITT